MLRTGHKFFNLSVTLLVALAMNVCMCFAAAPIPHRADTASLQASAGDHRCCTQESSSEQRSSHTPQKSDPCGDCNIKHAPTSSVPDHSSDGVPPLTALPAEAVSADASFTTGSASSIALINDSPPLLQDLFHNHCLLTC